MCSFLLIQKKAQAGFANHFAQLGSLWWRKDGLGSRKRHRRESKINRRSSSKAGGEHRRRQGLVARAPRVVRVASTARGRWGPREKRSVRR